MLQRQMTVSGKPQRLRRLVIVLGDQLDRDNPLLQGLDPGQDLVFMAEVREEATHVRSHKARIALFLAAMRHFRDDLLRRGIGRELASVGGKITHHRETFRRQYG